MKHRSRRGKDFNRAALSLFTNKTWNRWKNNERREFAMINCGHRAGCLSATLLPNIWFGSVSNMSISVENIRKQERKCLLSVRGSARNWFSHTPSPNLFNTLDPLSFFSFFMSLVRYPKALHRWQNVFGHKALLIYQSTFFNFTENSKKRGENLNRNRWASRLKVADVGHVLLVSFFGKPKATSR